MLGTAVTGDNAPLAEHLANHVSRDGLVVLNLAAVLAQKRPRDAFLRASAAVSCQFAEHDRLVHMRHSHVRLDELKKLFEGHWLTRANG